MDTPLELALRALLVTRLGSRAENEDISAAVSESALLAREIGRLRMLLGPGDTPDGLRRMLHAK